MDDTPEPKPEPEVLDAQAKLDEQATEHVEPNNDSARTNEILAERAKVDEGDPVAESIRLNDPSRTLNAHTSDKSGFNEDLQDDEEEF